ncbi:TPA: hypothetical protein ACF2XH_004414 [Escherichia coli]
MAKIYDFPQGAERRRMHRKIQWNNAVKLSKNGWSKPEVKRWSFLAFISTGWYYFRLSVAVIFHIITICGLAVLAALSNTIFWIGGAICLVTCIQMTIKFGVLTILLSLLFSDFGC